MDGVLFLRVPTMCILYIYIYIRLCVYEYVYMYIYMYILDPPNTLFSASQTVRPLM